MMNIKWKCSNNLSGHLVVVKSMHHCDFWRWQNGRYSTTAFPSSVCFEEYRNRKMNKPMAPANVAIPRIIPTTMFISRPMQRRCVYFSRCLSRLTVMFFCVHIYIFITLHPDICLGANLGGRISGMKMHFQIVPFWNLTI